MLNKEKKLNNFILRNYSVVSVMKDDLDSCVTFEKARFEVGTAVLNDFENRLRALISEILNKDIPFEQSVSKKCTYCPFARICGIE